MGTYADGIKSKKGRARQRAIFKAGKEIWWQGRQKHLAKRYAEAGHQFRVQRGRSTTAGKNQAGKRSRTNNKVTCRVCARIWKGAHLMTGPIDQCEGRGKRLELFTSAARRGLWKHANVEEKEWFTKAWNLTVKEKERLEGKRKKQ